MAPFDITITDNKTKSQATFYSFNMDSTQNSMGPPFNPEFSFNNGAGTTTEQFITGDLFAPLPLTNNNQTSGDNDNDNDNDNDGSDNDNNHKNSKSNSGNNAKKGGSDLLNCKDFNEKDIPVGTNDPNNLDGDGDGIGCDSKAAVPARKILPIS